MVQRSSVARSFRFSKYKNLEESAYFILQQRKTPVVSKRGHRPTYRIITKGVPYYEVAYDFDLDNLRARVRCVEDVWCRVLTVNCLQEWNYINNDLPNHMPNYLTPKSRLKWYAMASPFSIIYSRLLRRLLAHFTQLALETDGAQPQLESDDDEDGPTTPQLSVFASLLRRSLLTFACAGRGWQVACASVEEGRR